MNSELPFVDTETRREWARYFERVEAMTDLLPPEQRREITLELQDHLISSFETMSDGDEASRLRRATAKLGDPGDYLKALVADRLTTRAADSERPGDVFRALRYNLFAGVRRAVWAGFLGIGYLLGFLLVLFAVLKPFFPDNIGLFITPGGWPLIGYVDIADGREVLGYWIVPIGLVGAFLVYRLFTRLLARWSKDIKL